MGRGETHGGVEGPKALLPLQGHMSHDPPLPSTHMALLVPGQDVTIPCVVAAKPVGMGDMRSGWKRGGEEEGGERTTSRLLIDS